MSRPNLQRIAIAAVTIAVAITAFLFLKDSDGPSTNDASVAVADMRELLLSSPYEMQINLSVRVPKGTEPDNQPLQKIDAVGLADLSSSQGDFTYDFNDVVNAAGYLGHIDEMQVLYSDDSVYFEVFAEQPAWLRAEPEDVNEDQNGRLREILLTNPLTIASYLEVEFSLRETSDGLSLAVAPESLADAMDPMAAEVGAFLDKRGVDEIEVELTAGENGPEVIIVSFTYDGLEGLDIPMAIVATYELTPASAPELEIPTGDDLRELSDLFS